MTNGIIKPKHWKGVQMGISIPSHPASRQPRPLVTSVKWHPPEGPWIKVNTDGAYTGAPDRAGGGEVVRDWSGKLLAAFSTPLDAHSALEAKLMAAHHGLELARVHEQPIWIEMDSEQAAKLLNGFTWGPAHLRRVMARIFLFKHRYTMRASYIPREENQEADLLAKMGLGQQCFLRFSTQDP
ncbi:uncharacterized protein LOC121810553 [Salvia splendens]|uniref:uncharacterized protein LOC121810553 n=1 Tax=Salvia splendens TaxID=180675 RepID=UPI001C27E2F4|nr:uncharacterized protein LOC121810553 [Salvia splendens]